MLLSNMMKELGADFCSIYNIWLQTDFEIVVKAFCFGLAMML